MMSKKEIDRIDPGFWAKNRNIGKVRLLLWDMNTRGSIIVRSGIGASINIL